MSLIKSYSVGNGDMFIIEHNTDNFTIIDCCLNDDTADRILSEIAALSQPKGVKRFISTHPDDDHIRGLKRLDDRLGILNFYCVANNATKEDETDDFTRYCELRDSDKAFQLSKGCKRKWMNESDEERKSAGIDIIWPELENETFQEALAMSAAGESPNNISAVVQYSVQEGATVLWMGDLETEFQEEIEDSIALPSVHVLFAPHHGRDSGTVPESMLATMSPRVIVIGEAPSKHLNYYSDYNTITQNSAGDITLVCESAKVHFFTSEEYSVDFLDDEGRTMSGQYYLGTLDL
jgi:beta-lactamase superfamily II metal-dependent hydrolase